MKWIQRAVWPWLLAALFVLLLPRLARAEGPEAPFGDKVSPKFLNYNRASPFIGSAGELAEGGVREAKRLGFKVIVDLRTPAQGAAAEAKEAQAVGIRYINIPVSALAPTEAQLEEFAGLLKRRELYPILIHCESANRVGAMWALHRAKNQGVPAEIAVEEGRTLGLKPNREARVRAMLHLPPLPK